GKRIIPLLLATERNVTLRLSNGKEANIVASTRFDSFGLPFPETVPCGQVGQSELTIKSIMGKLFELQGIFVDPASSATLATSLAQKLQPKRTKRTKHTGPGLARQPDPNPCIQRTSILQQVRETLSSNSRLCLLMGLGGSGKSFVAATYLRSLDSKIVDFWNADTEESLKRDYADFFASVDDNPPIDPKIFAGATVARLVQTYKVPDHHAPHTVVLDNANQETLQMIAAILAAFPKTAFLITSRMDLSLQTYTACAKLTLLPPDESDVIDFMMKGLSFPRDAIAQKLVPATTCLPLRVVTAVAFCAASLTDIDGYVAMIDKVRSGGLKVDPKMRDQFYPEVSLSLDTLKLQDNETAWIIMTYCAFLNKPDRISRNRLRRFFTTLDLYRTPDATLDELNFNMAIAIVTKLLLLSPVPTEPNSDWRLSLHRFVRDELAFSVRKDASLTRRAELAQAYLENGQTPLHVAASRGDCERVQECLERGGDHIDTKDDMGRTALVCAVTAGSEEVCRMLFKGGASLSAAEGYYPSPLLYEAAKRGYHGVCASLLEDGGANVNCRGTGLGSDRKGGEVHKTPLHIACDLNHLEVASVLLSHGADVSLQDADGLLPEGYATGQCTCLIQRHKKCFTALHAEEHSTQDPMHVASIRGDIEWLSRLVSEGHDVNVPFSPIMWTPLHFSAIRGHIDIAIFLVEHGANINAMDVVETTPLMLAVQNGHVDLVRALRQRGATIGWHGGINIRINTDSRGVAKSSWFTHPSSTIIHKAVQYGREDMVELLLEDRELHINGRDFQWGFTPLHYAALLGYDRIAKLLISRGARVDLEDINGLTALRQSAGKGHVKVAQVLIEHGAECFPTNEQNVTPLHVAAEGGHSEFVKLMLANLSEENRTMLDVGAATVVNRTALHLAAQNGHVNVAELLLEAGAAVDAQDNEKFTPLHTAVEHGHLVLAAMLVTNKANVEAKTEISWTPLLVAVEYHQLEIARFLIRSGASVIAKARDGSSPLHFAVKKHAYELAKLLVEKGALVNDVQGPDRLRTPLHGAAMLGDKDMCAWLLDNGAEVDVQDVTDNQPLHWAARGGFVDVAKLLMERGADPNAVNVERETALHVAAKSGSRTLVALLLENRGNEARPSLNASDRQGYTPLHNAAAKVSYDIAEMLIDCGADVNAVTGQKWTVLHSAAKGGNQKLVSLLLEKMESGALEAVNDNEHTPLHTAAWNSHEGVVKILLAKGASSAAHAAGWTALHLAAQQGYAKVAAVLLSDGVKTDAERHALLNACTEEQHLTALYLAVWTEQMEVFKLLLENGAMIDVKGAQGSTALHIAAQRANAEMVELLLEAGASVAVRDDKSQIPLHMAATMPLTNIGRLIEKDPTLVNAGRFDQLTPLHLASEYGERHAVKVLLEHGADVAVCDIKNQTPLHLAAAQGHIEIAILLGVHGADILATDNEQMTPLDLATRNRHERTVALFREMLEDLELREILEDLQRDVAVESGVGGMVGLVEEGTTDGTAGGAEDSEAVTSVVASTSDTRVEGNQVEDGGAGNAASLGKGTAVAVDGRQEDPGTPTEDTGVVQVPVEPKVVSHHYGKGSGEAEVQSELDVSPRDGGMQADAEEADGAEYDIPNVAQHESEVENIIHEQEGISSSSPFAAVMPILQSIEDEKPAYLATNGEQEVLLQPRKPSNLFLMALELILYYVVEISIFFFHGRKD
ncbi:palmitoyltransferase akr1, partial [Borealophlyctis nickersoniae]